MYRGVERPAIPLLNLPQGRRNNLRFQGAPQQLAKELGETAVREAGDQVAKIANIGFAEKIFKIFGRLNADVRQGGLSLEDMAARLLTVIGIYIPQGYLSIKENKHKWETNGRNVVVWTMTLGLTWLLKNDKWGTNTLLDKFMHPKVAEDQTRGLIDRLINKVRLPVDYVDILKAADLVEKDFAPKGAYWSKLDANKLSKINNFFDDLKARAQKGALGEIEVIDKKLVNGEMKNVTRKIAEKEILEALPGFIKRMNIFPLVSTTLITAATVYIIGDIAMRIVYKFIAPFDHDFDPDRVKKKKSGNAQPASASAASPAMRSISMHQPRAFQAFARQPQFTGGIKGEGRHV